MWAVHTWQARRRPQHQPVRPQALLGRGNGDALQPPRLVPLVPSNATATLAVVPAAAPARFELEARGGRLMRQGGEGAGGQTEGRV